MKMHNRTALYNSSFRCTANAITAAPTPLAVTFELAGTYKNTSTHVIRCTKCRGYISPYCEVLSPGEQWRCALCRHLNVVDTPFISRNGFLNNDAFNPLRNYAFNAENMCDERLTSLKLEMDASSAYLKQCSYVFVVECTADAYKRGVVSSVCNTLRANVHCLGSARVGVVFYAKTLCIVARGGALVVSDFEHLPLFNMDDILFDAQCMPELESTAEFLGRDASVHCDFGGVLRVVHAMLGTSGGSVVAFLSSVPNTGKASLAGQPASLRCKNEYYKTMAAAFSKCNISLSYYVFSCRNADLPSLSLLSRFTGGFLAYFPNFDANDRTFSCRLDEHVHAFLSGTKAYEGVLRVRGSNVQIVDYFGNFHLRASDVLSLCAVNFGHSITFGFKMNEGVAEQSTRNSAKDDLSAVNKILNEISENDACGLSCTDDELADDGGDKTAFVNNFLVGADDWVVFQVALMYSDERGSRRLRTNNFVVPVVKTRQAMVNEYAMAHFVFLKAINEEMGGKSGLDVVDRFVEQMAEEKCLGNMGRLMLSIKKSVVLRPVLYTPMDYRAFYVYLVLTSPLRLINRLIYPLLYDVATEERKELSLDSLEIDGFYVLDAGYNLFFFVGAGVDTNPEILELVNSCFADELTGRVLPKEYDNEYSKHLNSLVRRLRTGIRLVPNYYYIRDDGSNNVYKDIFFSYFYDDSGHNLESVGEYVKSIRRRMK
ncbi:Vesicle coat complex COPII, subunit SEC24/subunit SFB2 [Trachipleistophora hominis]|uniref:Vesicle coat complex COPII, subunit SEC24/subunit SFB2 n=1 Tax=Trachipleistophora hominis TaxID=72359 RepID=L7JQY8_TRAHO|nr:Vesicle coat complex COPII, subunit SEC24/subunit SFB2 [Trachipleistophora hominis]